MVFVWSNFIHLNKRMLQVPVFRFYSEGSDFSSTVVPTKKDLRGLLFGKEQGRSKTTDSREDPNTGVVGLENEGDNVENDE